MSHSPLQPVTVHAVRGEARGIVSLDLRPSDGKRLPATEPGAHIDLHLPDGLVRSYSVVNLPGEEQRYLVAVLLDRQSRGGSRQVHEDLAVGTGLQVSAPRNRFPVDESAPKSVLVAGGIGITPLLAMRRRLRSLGRPVELLYCARSRAEAAFCGELESQPDVLMRFDDEAGAPPDLASMIAGHAPSTHFYCCGPGPMIGAFEAACASLGYPHVHVERFSADGVVDAAQGSGYRVFLARSERTIDVPACLPLLDALEGAGVSVDSACREGMCGACETRVLEGVPDHRDSILTEGERASNRIMLVCVSGCLGQRLVLDL